MSAGLILVALTAWLLTLASALPLRLGIAQIEKEANVGSGSSKPPDFIDWIPGPIVIEGDGSALSDAVAEKLAQLLRDTFGSSRRVEVAHGPRTTTYEISPAMYIRIHVNPKETTRDIRPWAQDLRSVVRFDCQESIVQPRSNQYDIRMPPAPAVGVIGASMAHVTNKGIGTSSAMQAMAVPVHAETIREWILKYVTGTETSNIVSVPGAATATALEKLIPPYAPPQDADVLDGLAPVLRGTGPALLMPNLTRWRLESPRPPTEVQAEIAEKLRTRGWIVSKRDLGDGIVIARKGLLRIRMVKSCPDVMEKHLFSPGDNYGYDVLYTEFMDDEKRVAALLSIPDVPDALLRYYGLALKPDELKKLEEKASPGVFALATEALRLMRSGKVKEAKLTMQAAYDRYKIYMPREDSPPLFTQGQVWTAYEISPISLIYRDADASRRAGLTELKPGIETDLGEFPIDSKTYAFFVDSNSHMATLTATLTPNTSGTNLSKGAMSVSIVFDIDVYGTAGGAHVTLTPGTSGVFLARMQRDGKIIGSTIRGEVFLSADGTRYHIKAQLVTPDAKVETPVK